jgi:hypothetical protein
MARSARSSKLETRSTRLALPVREAGKSYTVRIGPGVRLGYRRKKTAGRWSVIVADGKRGNWLKAFGDADDFEEANGSTVLNFWQAQDIAFQAITTSNCPLAASRCRASKAGRLSRPLAPLMP